MSRTSCIHEENENCIMNFGQEIFIEIIHKQHRKFPHLFCCLLFIIHIYLSPPLETLSCQHVVGYSVMAEKSMVFINGSLLLYLCLWTRICTQHFIVRLDSFRCEVWGLVGGSTV
jgi:hypothetical protein